MMEISSMKIFKGGIRQYVLVGIYEEVFLFYFISF